MQKKFLKFVVLAGSLIPPAMAAAPGGQSTGKVKTPPADVAAGKRLFERHCALCHGIDGKGGRGPSLNRVHLPHAQDDAALKAVIEDGIPPKMPEGWFLDEDDIANLAAYVHSLGKIPAAPVAGNVMRGAAVYAKSGCSGCHILGGLGAAYGPELTGIGDLRSATYVRKAISNPSSALPEDFLFVRAKTASGATIEGIRVNEDTFTIQIRDSRGKFHSLRKEELTELNKLRGETPMPPFERILTEDEMQDLVAYLASQRGRP